MRCARLPVLYPGFAGKAPTLRVLLAAPSPTCGRRIVEVAMRHEAAGAFAAGAEAQLTGRLVACAGSCGPDNLHLINGLSDAHRSMAPVLALAAQIPSTEIGTGYFQETHALPDRPEDPGLRR